MLELVTNPEFYPYKEPERVWISVEARHGGVRFGQQVAGGNSWIDTPLAGAPPDLAQCGGVVLNKFEHLHRQLEVTAAVRIGDAAERRGPDRRSGRALILEPCVEPVCHQDSYGYRPGGDHPQVPCPGWAPPPVVAVMTLL